VKKPGKKTVKKKKISKKPGKAGQGKKSVGRKNPGPMVPYDEVNEIVNFLEERGLEEFELERSGIRIRIKRQGFSSPVMHAPMPTASPAPSPTTTEPASPEESIGDDVHLIKSPIVGTFYAASNPDSQPFVKTGDKVKVGQVLCIVEAMKLMNEIESDVAGEVVKIFGENAQPVEYGAPLFAIRPA
jgi:acetyl-CoA carboxylase biotin carboxyl carrier protein